MINFQFHWVLKKKGFWAILRKTILRDNDCFSLQLLQFSSDFFQIWQDYSLSGFVVSLKVSLESLHSLSLQKIIYVPPVNFKWGVGVRERYTDPNCSGPLIHGPIQFKLGMDVHQGIVDLQLLAFSSAFIFLDGRPPPIWTWVQNSPNRVFLAVPPQSSSSAYACFENSDFCLNVFFRLTCTSD